MAKSRAQKSIMNIGVMGVYELVTMICGLIVPRLILVAFGSSYNGITSSITQFLSFIAILRAGVAGASRVSLYKSLAEDDKATTSGILRATEAYLRKIAYVFLIYLTILAVFYKQLSGVDIAWWDSASLVMIIGLGTFAQYYFGLTYQTLLAADQKNYVYYIQQIVVTILNTIIAVVLIKAGATIQMVKMGSAVIFVASPILLSYYVSKKYSIDKKCLPDKQALNQRWDVMGLAIANIVHDNTDVVVLTLFANVKIVSVYTVYNLVLSGVKKVLMVFTTGLEAAFGNMWAKGETKAILRNLGIFELLIFSFVSIVFSCTAILIIPFVRIYTDGVTDVEYIRPVYALIAVAAQACYCFRMPYLTLVQAAGHYKQTRNGAFFEAIINLGLSVILVWKFSVIGVAIGTLAADIFRTIQYASYCCRNLVEKTYGQIFRRFLWTVCNMAIVLGLYWISPAFIRVESWLSWLVLATIYFVIAVIVTVVTAVVFYWQDVKATWNVVKRMVNKSGEGA